MIYRLIMVSDAKIVHYFESKNFLPYKIQKNVGFCGAIFSNVGSFWGINYLHSLLVLYIFASSKKNRSFIFLKKSQFTI